MYCEFTKELFGKFINNTPVLVAIEICLIGAFLNYKLTSTKEKLNEIIRISNELFIKLTKERNNTTPMGGGVSRIEFDNLTTRFGIFRKIKFTKLINRYYKAKQDNYRRSEKTGAVFYEHTGTIKEAIDKLLKILR